MAVTKSTIAMKVVSVDKQVGPASSAVGYWVTYVSTTPDATTKMGTVCNKITVDQAAGTLPAVGDTVNWVIG